MKPYPLSEELEIFRQSCIRFTRDKIEPFVFEWEEAGEFPESLSGCGEGRRLGSGLSR